MPTDLIQLLKREVLVLDGAMGTMIQRYRFKEEDYRGDRFVSHDVRLSGCNDILCLVRPREIKDIHNAYLAAGADIISTNSFNANAVSMEDYGLQRYPGLIKEINRAAASIARECAENAPVRRWGGRALVAGSVGPTNRTASMSPEVNDPAFRNVTYDMLYEAYKEQTEGLIEGGADILLFETVFDTLNLKAGLDAANKAMESCGRELPIMI
ncbi:MAG: homocysteine S-methyltransferase family protein, partial [Muribaculaceae bacterium]|nr:homocysteine S-methyltransferase family protein [Muribaculaceae bacterium]